MALVRTDGSGRIVALTIPKHSMFLKETVSSGGGVLLIVTTP